MSVPNPLRAALLWVGAALARFDLIDRDRAERTTDLAWPRILTGLARMSKSAADVAMVGQAVGIAAIAGVGVGSAFWGLAFALGGGVAGGTISLVSQRYGADAHEELGRVITCSVVAVLAITLPLALAFAVLPETLVGIVGWGASDQAVGYGAAYLQVLAIGVPFAGLNLIGSRALVGADDAHTPMVIRGGGAVVNVVLNALFLFVLQWGVQGAALGTVLANALVTVTFAAALLRGHLPGVGEIPITVESVRPVVDRELFRDLVEIATPLTASALSFDLAQSVLLFFALFLGDSLAAAYIVGREVRGLLNTPGWGFGLASSSLVGQELGTGDEGTAGEYGRDILRFAVATYGVGAVIALVAAEPIAWLFVGEDASIGEASTFVRVAAVSVLFWGVSKGATGPLRAAGDTRWPFYANMLGLYGFAIPLIALGAFTPLGLAAVYLSILAETAVPAAVTYYRFATEKWKVISRDYRPETGAADD